MPFIPHISCNSGTMNEYNPIILTGNWSESSHPDKIIKIAQYIDFILFHMPDGSVRAINIPLEIGSGHPLDMRWLEPQECDHNTKKTAHRTILRVENENLMIEEETGVKWARV